MNAPGHSQAFIPEHEVRRVQGLAPGRSQAFIARHHLQRMPGSRPGSRSRGLALPAAIFLMVIVAGMLAAGFTLVTQSQHSHLLQLQSARALAAARSGADWGVWKVSDPTGALGLGGATHPDCFAPTALTLPGPLAGLALQVSCTREPASGTVDEGGLKLASYRVVAVATSGTSGQNDFVSRQIEARFTACRNPSGLAPRYGC